MDYKSDGCNLSDTLSWCYAHNTDCEQQPVKVCPGCKEKFRYAHPDCSALNAPALLPGDTLSITYTLTMDPSPMIQNYTVVQDTTRTASTWYTTQTVLPNTESAAQRTELLRSLREDPSMGNRGTKQFVASVEKKRLTTASSFDNALDIGLATDICLEQRQDSTMGGPGIKTDLPGLPNAEWIHVVIKPTKPNDLGILALRREGRFLQLHEVTSGARAQSEFPGVDRVFILPA